MTPSPCLGPPSPYRKQKPQSALHDVCQTQIAPPMCVRALGMPGFTDAGVSSAPLERPKVSP